MRTSSGEDLVLDPARGAVLAEGLPTRGGLRPQHLGRRHPIHRHYPQIDSGLAQLRGLRLAQYCFDLVGGPTLAVGSGDIRRIHPQFAHHLYPRRVDLARVDLEVHSRRVAGLGSCGCDGQQRGCGQDGDGHEHDRP